MKQLGLDGSEEEPANPRPREPINKLCLDPAVTRARADIGQPVPCHSCLAYRPLYSEGCFFLIPTSGKMEKDT